MHEPHIGAHDCKQQLRMCCRGHSLHTHTSEDVSVNVDETKRLVRTCPTTARAGGGRRAQCTASTKNEASCSMRCSNASMNTSAPITSLSSLLWSVSPSTSLFILTSKQIAQVKRCFVAKYFRHTTRQNTIIRHLHKELNKQTTKQNENILLQNLKKKQKYYKPNDLSMNIIEL